MKKFIINSGISFLLSVVLLGSFAYGAEEDSYLDPYVEGDLSIARCVAKGNLDFVTFLKSLSNFEGLRESFEPVLDITTRNQCQSGDVSSLIKQRNKIKSRIRDAFLLCQTEKLPKLKEGYYKVSAEIYYARHVVQGHVILSLPYGLLHTRMLEDPESLYYPENKLYREMYQRFVNDGPMEEFEFDVFFQNLKVKYQERKKEYVICENNAWETVANKWEEFIDTAAGVGPAADNFEERVGGGAEKIVEAATEGGLLDYITGKAQLNVNGLQPRSGVGEIYESILDNFPEMPISQDQLLNAVLSYEKRYDLEKLETSLRARFTSLYKDSADASIAIFLEELEIFNTTIENSFQYLEGVEDCSETMNLRQCPGK